MTHTDGVKYWIEKSLVEFPELFGVHVESGICRHSLFWCPDQPIPSLVSCPKTLGEMGGWQGSHTLTRWWGVRLCRVVLEGKLCDHDFQIYQENSAQVLRRLADWAAEKSKKSDVDIAKDDPFADSEFRSIILMSLWAHFFEEKLSLVWLAANALHAYAFDETGFAFGYLSCELDQKLRNEGHFLGWEGMRAHQSRGGQERAKAAAAEGAQLVAALDRLRKGPPCRSVAAAARAAAGQGWGGRPESIERRYRRYKRKLGQG